MEFLQIEWQSPWYEKAIKIRDQILRKPLGLIFTESDIAEEANQWHYGLLDGDQLVAVVVIVPLADHRAKLRQMAVIPSRQRQGLGTSLIKHVENALHEKGIQEIELHARDIAIAFYERFGFRREGDSFIEVSIPHFQMVKTL